MTFTALLTRPVVVHNLSAGLGHDAYGEPLAATGVTYQTLGHLEQTEATEVIVGQETYEARWLLVLDPGVRLEPFDRVEVPDLSALFDVIGTPNRPWRPATGEHHVEARLALVTEGA